MLPCEITDFSKYKHLKENLFKSVSKKERKKRQKELNDNI